jgi:hypothetical protein
MPFWLLDFLISLVFGICSTASKFSNGLDEDLKMVLESIDSKDLKMIFKELKQYGTFDLVDINDGDETLVKISVL